MVIQRSSQEVEFRFFRPNARQVYLVGDFNGWDHHRHPMNRQMDGEWRIRLQLPEGVHQFRYLADDEWFADYAAFGLEQGPYGWNSVLVVEGEQPAATALEPALA